MRLLTLTTAAVAAICFMTAAPASAHLIGSHQRPPLSKKNTVAAVKATIRYQQVNLAHTRGAVRWLEMIAAERRASADVIDRATGVVLSPTEQAKLRWHRVWTKILTQELHESQALFKRLTAPHYASGPVGHLAMWLCIHGYEGAWNSNTGNGYYGGLQMTWGWGPLPGGAGGGAHMYSPGYQMSIAESEWRATGYSMSWLYGQWPNTAPRCT